MPPTDIPRRLPLVVPIGFAGSRRLLADGLQLNDAERAAFEQEVENRLVKVLEELPAKLGLKEHHFLCAASQIAAGADLHFTAACKAAQISQRILLPLPRAKYLEDRGTNGDDFTAEERKTAEALLGSAHIIEERVVSNAAERTARFEDVNLEILAISEIFICLLREEAESKAGGTHEVLWGGIKRLKPTLEIRVGWHDGKPRFTEIWHQGWFSSAAKNQPTGCVAGLLGALKNCGCSPAKKHEPKSRRNWEPPALPEELEQILMPRQTAPSPGVPALATEYFTALKEAGSQLADLRKTVFKWAALIIIGAHILATATAVFALKMKHDDWLVSWLLGAELLLLFTGLMTHHRLHHGRSSRVWALSRVIAEVARSVKAIKDHHVYLRHLFSLPFPPTLRPLLRTINVLHLASTRQSQALWIDKLMSYLMARLCGPDGQLHYYRNSLAIAKFWRKAAGCFFYSASALAFLCTLTKLWMTLFDGHPPPVLGICAIILPVVAVGALSLAASFDLEARIETYGETCEALEEVRDLIASARSENEFTRLVLETETRLLGETANWCARRSFTGVS